MTREPTGTRATVLGKPAPAADDAAAADSAAPKTLPDAVDAAATVDAVAAADEVAAVPGDAADVAAPDSPADAPSAAPAALTSSSGPEAAQAAHQAPDAVAADTAANAASNTAPGATETRTGAPDSPAADTPGRNQPGDVLQGPLADVRDQAQPGGSDAPWAPPRTPAIRCRTAAVSGLSPALQPTRVSRSNLAPTMLSARPPERPRRPHPRRTTSNPVPTMPSAPPRGEHAVHVVLPRARPACDRRADRHPPRCAIVRRGQARHPPGLCTCHGVRCRPGPRTVLRYDGDALVVARLVTALGEYGLEPRHLRQVKAAADREAALAEQIVAPLLHRRGAGAKSGAEETVRDLLSLTSRLHTVLVSSALRPLLDR
ncbi:hypothetical protein ACU686_41185 [Yinghuangia aomiensis]